MVLSAAIIKNISVFKAVSYAIVVSITPEPTIVVVPLIFFIAPSYLKKLTSFFSPVGSVSQVKIACISKPIT